MSSTHSTESAQILHFSCPSCGKRYNSKRVGSGQCRPEFKCQRCETFFAIAKVDEQGFAVTTVLKSGPRASVCPKCGTLNSVSQQECRVCGVVFSKYKENDWHLTQGNKWLDFEWRNVLNDYEDREAHERFINACRDNDALAFAMQKYQGLVDLIPDDEIAEEMKSKIKVLVSLPVKEKKKAKPVVRRQRMSLKWLVPALFLLPLVIGACLLLFGLKSYEFRNLAGLGAGILVLSAGILVYFKK